MAGILGRFRPQVPSGIIQVQRVKVISGSRVRKFFLEGSIFALFLLLPYPERILPANVQEMLVKRNKPAEHEYGDSWQQERRRLEQAKQGSGNAESMLDRGSRSGNAPGKKGAIFIPVTWLRKRKREYFTASDPEWQRFMKLSGDSERVKAVKSRLAALICAEVAKNQRLTRVVGTPLAVSATWLDFRFPSITPVEYERSGILWFDNKMIWVTRRFDERQSMRLYRVFFPKALFSSLQTLSSNLLASHYASLKSVWSSQGKREYQSPVNKPAGGPPSPATRQDESKSVPTISVQKRSSASPQTLTSATRSIVPSELVRHIMPDPEPNSAISAAAKAFKLNFLKEWRRSPFGYPRGVCILEGQVGVRGPNGRCKMTVTALYLPEKDQLLEIRGISTSVWTNSPLEKPDSKP